MSGKPVLSESKPLAQLELRTAAGAQSSASVSEWADCFFCFSIVII